MKLDRNQEKIINYDKNLLVIASAGCGKTFCITKKINKILNNINPKDILVISFTNETVNDLKKKLPDDINILTFHKLAIKVLKKSNITYSLTNETLLKYIIDEYFLNIISSEDKTKLLRYFFSFNYSKFIISKNLIDFKKIIFTFIKMMQCNNLDFNYFLKIFSNEKDKFLLSIIMKIYYIYDNEKVSQNKLDLDDLIIKASEIANKNKFNYKYIFVDEFQDTSEIRMNLIYNIYKNSNSIINFYGDDFQSIYAFSGCKLDIMLNIKKYIPNIKLMILDKNFRSDNKLISTANKFVLRNKSQIRKNIRSDNFIENAINLIYYNNYYKDLSKLLHQLSKETNDILLLGRYKNDFYQFKDKYRCLTIHESKGLESEYVVILNLKNDLYGFPSKLKNSHLLDYFYKNKESILYAEERRLFYVAITRAKKKVYLYIPKNNKSSFIKEYLKIIK